MTILEKTPVIINATFQSINCKAYRIKQLDLTIGQKVLLEIVSPIAPVPEWDANNDQVLDILDDGKSAIITPLQAGTSVIKFIIGTAIIAELTINVLPKANIATTVKFVKSDYRKQ